MDRPSLFSEIDAPRVQRVGSVEAWARARGLTSLIGVDEVGRGPLAGPVVAAAVALPPDHGIQGLDDSKRLSESRRASLAREVHARALGVALVEVSAQEIDRSNILRAALFAMAVAARRVAQRCGKPQLLLVDGNKEVPLGFAQRTVVGGDALSEHIAAASIVAKVYRDAVMATHDLSWPDYGFVRNAGYGTAEHRKALKRLGPCPIHRRSFRGTT